MTTQANETATDVAARKLFIATKLAGQLVNQLDRLERELAEDLPFSRQQLHGQVEDITQLASVLHDELVELELD